MEIGCFAFGFSYLKNMTAKWYKTSINALLYSECAKKKMIITAILF